MKCLSVGVESIEDLMKAVVGIPCLMHTHLDLFGNSNKTTGQLFCFIVQSSVVMVVYVNAMPKGKFLIYNIYTRTHNWSDSYNVKEVEDSPSSYIIIPVVSVENIEEIVI